MRRMFAFCAELESIPDISNWNTSNVKNMNSMFLSCESLESIPDIFKWNTMNVKDMNSIFVGCYSILSRQEFSQIREKFNSNNY